MHRISLPINRALISLQSSCAIKLGIPGGGKWVFDVFHSLRTTSALSIPPMSLNSRLVWGEHSHPPSETGKLHIKQVQLGVEKKRGGGSLPLSPDLAGLVGKLHFNWSFGISPVVSVSKDYVPLWLMLKYGGFCIRLSPKQLHFFSKVSSTSSQKSVVPEGLKLTANVGGFLQI